MQPASRFLVDPTLGRLAKWLRLLGYDAVYVRSGTGSSGSDGPALARRARVEGRILLTRNRRLGTARAGPRTVLVRSNAVTEQLAHVVAECGLEVGAHVFSRCAVCNVPIEMTPAATARESVPPYVWLTHSQFARCPQCGRIYWDGTHRRNMRAVFDRLNGTSS